MDRRSPHLSVAVLCGALAACCLPGCQYAYDYEVRGVLKECSGGVALAGARVNLEGSGILVKPTYAMTGDDGGFSLRFRIRDSEFSPGQMPHWSLTLSKEGFADEVVDISPSQEPKSSAPNPIVVVAFLRAKQ